MKKVVFFFVLLSFTTSAQVVVTKTAPDLRLEFLDGKNTTLYSLLEKGPILIDFWATWCEPCKKEMVFLDKYHRTYVDSGFTVLSINQDTPRSLSKVKAFIRSKRYSFLVAKDPNKQIAQKLNVQVLPTTFLVLPSGIIIWQHVGYLPGDEKDIEEQILKALKQ